MLNAEIPIGSVVYLTIDNADGGMGIVLQRNIKHNTYLVYRLSHDDMDWYNLWEMHVDWSPTY